MAIKNYPGVTVRKVEGGTLSTGEPANAAYDVYIGNTLVTQLRKSSDSLVDQEVKKISDAAQVFFNHYNRMDSLNRVNTPANVVKALGNRTALKSMPTTLAAINKAVEVETTKKLAEKARAEAEAAREALGDYSGRLQSQADRLADRGQSGPQFDQLTENADGTFRVPGGGTFSTREAAELALSTYLELPDMGQLRGLQQQRTQAEATLAGRPPAEQTPEYEQEKQAALARFREFQDLRDYGGGPMDNETLRKKLLAQTGSNTQTFNPALLNDQDFLNQLRDMGVTQIIRGSVDSTEQRPTFDLLTIAPVSGRDAEGRPMLAARVQRSGADFQDFAVNTSPDILANVFWSPRTVSSVGEVERFYDPSISIGAIQSFNDVRNPERLGKPTAAQFAQLVGKPVQEVMSAWRGYGPITDGADLRDWGKILQSEDPFTAAIAANRAQASRYLTSTKEVNRIDPATGQVLKGDTPREDARMVAKAGNFAVLRTGADRTPQVYVVDPTTNVILTSVNPWGPNFDSDLKRLGLGTEGLESLTQTLSGMQDSPWAQDFAAGFRQYLDTSGESATITGEGGDQFLRQIPQEWDTLLRNWRTDMPIEEKNKVLRSDIVRFQDVNTGEMKEGLVGNNLISSKPQRLEELMRLGAIPQFDLKNFENLPNYPDDFRRIMGRDVTLADFEAYGYDDPQAAFDLAQRQSGDQQPSQAPSQQTDQQMQDLLGTRTPTFSSRPTYGSQAPTTPQAPTTTPQQPVAPEVPATGMTTPQQQPAGTPSFGGTFSVPTATAGMSAVPQFQRSGLPEQAGFNMTQLTSTMPGGMGTPSAETQTVNYTNRSTGQTIPVTEQGGRPITYVPPGFTRGSTGSSSSQVLTNQQTANLRGFNEGGSVENDAELDAMYRMATKFLGYRGPRSRKALEDFAKSSPAASTKMRAYTAAMARGGLVKGYQAGGTVATTVYDPEGFGTAPANRTTGSSTGSSAQMSETQLARLGAGMIQQTMQPMQAPVQLMQPTAADFIPQGAGQTYETAPFAEAATIGTTAQAAQPQFMTPAAFTAQQAAPQVAAETAQLQAAQGQVSQQAQVQAAQQQGTAVSGIEAAQGTAILMDNPVQREIQQGELISGSAVDATKVAELNSQLQAAQATPTAQATVQGQLEGLMAQFEGGQTPAWAAGAMRNATAMLSARGLGASSLAGQAVVQAAMESALPIAQMDAQTRAQFEAQNLSNRQQTAMMAAQQRAAFLQLEFDQEFQSRVQNASRIADIANMNFTAEQQVALENSRIANTTNLQNLNNRQAKVMAEAAALANLDMANLNNRQQAAVQNAQAFLQTDLTNLNNEQQTGLFKAQQNIQALFTDQAAENAALQFNAASENQTNQFFSNLAAQVSQFNATQQNAMDQFNVNSVNAMRQFNSEIQQQRDLFNAQNGLVVAQANAQWRQNIATLNNATQNQSNMEFARTMNALTATNLDQIWQRERDIMSYAFTQSESGLDRALSILLADKELDAYREKMAAEQRDARAAFGTSILLEWMRS